MSRTGKPLRVLMVGVGTLDLVTGLALLIDPVFTLRTMGVSPGESGSAIFLRWIGVFVGCVGWSYLRASRQSRETAEETLRFTFWFRLAVGLFCSGAIAGRALSGSWWPVAATDLTLAAAQFWILRSKERV